MAFVNEELTEEERALFEQRCITNPVYGDGHILKPKRWTIDRDKGAFIIRLGVIRDWPDEKVFFYQLRDMHMIISVKYEYVRENTVIYSLDNTNSYFSPLSEIKNDELVCELKDVLAQALEQFKIKGTSDERNMSTKVICKF